MQYNGCLHKLSQFRELVCVHGLYEDHALLQSVAECIVMCRATQIGVLNVQCQHFLVPAYCLMPDSA